MGILFKTRHRQNSLTHPANKFVENLVGQDRLVQARADVTTVEQIMLKTQPRSPQANHWLKRFC